LSRHCALIINPTAGSYSERNVAEVTTALGACGFSPETCLTGSPEDAARFAREVSAARREPFIVVCGGDGTVNGVLNGLDPGRATLAVLPFGTSNVLARELGIFSRDDGLRKIAAGVSRPLSVGLLEAAGTRRVFSLMAGVGFDGTVVAGMRPEEKKRFGKLAYILSAVRLLGAWERNLLEVVADGEKRLCHSVVVCNASRYGGNFTLARDADILSPGFSVICIRSSARRAYVRLALNVLRGKSIECPDVEVITARTLTVSGDKAVQADGDYMCRGPIVIRAVEGFARIVV
jgi:diacylglycerol kinase (ATP)